MTKQDENPAEGPGLTGYAASEKAVGQHRHAQGKGPAEPAPGLHRPPASGALRPAN